MSSPDLTLSSLFSVKGKVALVTGGSSGIGKMIASGFAQNGAKVYIAARTEAELKEAANEINKMRPGSVHYIVANVGSKAGCDALINEFKKRESKLHILVNNSGITWAGPFADFPEEKWDSVFAVNVKGIFYMTTGLSDLLMKDSNNIDPARVINISSIASVSPRADSFLSGDGYWAYLPSKAAVNHLTSALAMKLGPHHVTVNSILPGLFPSKLSADVLKTSEDVFIAAQPTGRYGTPQDMAGMALFLASPASAHVTGAHILLEGGSRYGGGAASASTKL